MKTNNIRHHCLNLGISEAKNHNRHLLKDVLSISTENYMVNIWYKKFEKLIIRWRISYQ